MTEGEIANTWREWQSKLKLSHHDITIRFDNSESDCFAWAKPSRNYDRGDVTFYTQQTERLNDRDIEATIVHELLHFKHKEVEDVFELLEPHVHRDAWQVFDKASEDVCEQFIDRMAYILMEMAGR